MSSAAVLRSLVVAALLGVPVALAAMLLMESIHQLEHVVWHDVPGRLPGGEEGPPGWYVLATTTAAATIAALLLSRVRPGATHEVSLAPAPLRHLPWMLGGAAATLAGGMVLGPEAPLLALGIAMMGVAARSTSDPFDSDDREPYTTVLALAGATTVLGMVLGSALVAIVLMLEIVAASGRLASKQIVAALVPSMLSAGVGALVFTGVGSWTGIAPPTLAIPDLLGYPTVQWLDLMLAPPVALAAAMVVVAIGRASHRVQPLVAARPLLATTLIGLATGALAVAYHALTDRPVSDVLFSGQGALPDVVDIDVVWILVTLVAAKGVAYALALVGQLEGGQIFPALAISGAVGTAAALLVPDASLTAMLVVAVAAGTTALQRLPIFGVVFALVVVAGPHSFDLAPLAVIGGVVGYVVSSAMARRSNDEAPAAAAGNESPT